MQKLLRFIFLISTISIYTQHKNVVISGEVSDKLGEVINAHVINTTTKLGAFTDEKGFFSIKASLGDILEISSVQHHTIKFTVANISLKTKQIKIQLYLKDYLLDEVEIKKTNLSGSLISDTKMVKKTKREEVMDNLGFNPYIKKTPKIDREIYTASTGGGQIPLDLIINSLSGRMKLLKKRKELAENEKKMQYLENNFRAHLIKDLKIDSLEVTKFIYFCHSDKSFKEVFEKGDFKIIPFLKEQAKLFKKINSKKTR